MGKTVTYGSNWNFNALAVRTNLTADVSSGDVDLIHRWEFAETGGGTAVIAGNLYASYNGGTYFDVGSASSYIQSSTAALTDDATILEASAYFTGGGTYVTGRQDNDGVNTSTITVSNQISEVWFSVKVIAADVNNGDTIDLRFYDSSNAMGSYISTPQINITKTVAARRIFITHL